MRWRSSWLFIPNARAIVSARLSLPIGKNPRSPETYPNFLCRGQTARPGSAAFARIAATWSCSRCSNRLDCCSRIPISPLVRIRNSADQSESAGQSPWISGLPARISDSMAAIMLPLAGPLYRSHRRPGHRRPTWRSSPSIPGSGARRRLAWSRRRRTDPQRHLLSCCCSATRVRSTQPVSQSDESGSHPASSLPTMSIGFYRRTRGPSGPRRDSRRGARAETCSGRSPRESVFGPDYLAAYREARGLKYVLKLPLPLRRVTHVKRGTWRHRHPDSAKCTFEKLLEVPIGHIPELIPRR